jgi:hypothetical protein
VEGLLDHTLIIARQVELRIGLALNCVDIVPAAAGQPLDQMGFERIGRTRFDGLALARLAPTLADLIRPTS